MRWEKKGLIYLSSGEDGWRNNSALQPTPLIMNDRVRVFVGFRDKNGVGRVGYVDLSIDNPSVILGISKAPALDIGRDGMFDDNGVIPTCVLKVGDAIYLYYAGYNLGKHIRFTVFTGLAISLDFGNSFTRVQETPVTDRVPEEELFRVIHSVFYDSNKWMLWYGGGNHFINGEKKTLPAYDIRYLESDDKLKFPHKKGKTVMHTHRECYRVGRPYVFKENGKFKMYYGYSSEGCHYQLAYAESKDGVIWNKKDINLHLSNEGWDSEMMAYPAFIRVNKKGFLFYNGNKYGKSGFGYAELIDEL